MQTPIYHQYIIMPERGKWIHRTATGAEMAYRLECCWFNPNTFVAVMDSETKETKIFTHTLDKGGNLDEVKEVTAL